MTEAELQAAVIELATLLRWRIYHTHIAKGSQEGFPDLVLLRPPRLLFAELKDRKREPTTAQQQWLDELSQIDEAVETLCNQRNADLLFTASEGRPGIEAYLWRPDEWVSGEIEKILR